MAADLTGVQAYQAAIRSAQNVAGGSDKAESPEFDFGNLVADAINQTSGALGNAEQLTAASATGQAEMIDVATAVSAAEISLETMVAVRDEVVRAYQEILRMPM
ncbi:flagellar hook-basal body complex protein FliE [Maricaulis sp.]|uniref:flagellar hook-basal body complex protein FliE n=1 Tax=Maricaulis sp. TaxID=1486257 RepID=UPI003A8E384D